MDWGWKQFERRIATLFGGRRRGPDFTAPGGGKSDVAFGDPAAPSIECKLLSRPTYGALVAAVRQAEKNGLPGTLAFAVVKKKNVQDRDALVVLRLGHIDAHLAELAQKESPPVANATEGPAIATPAAR